MLSTPLQDYNSTFTKFDLTASDPISFEPGTTMKEIEKFVILETLRHQSFNRTRTAKVLGIGIRTLQRKLKRYQQDDIAGEPLLEDLSVS